MRSIIRYAFLTTFLLTVGGLALSAAETTVNLYLAPDAGTPVVGEVPRAEARANSLAVLDEERAEAGWRFFERTASYTGYVPAEDLRKGLQVREGALIRRAAEPGARVLTTVLPQTEVQVEAIDEWVTVTFTAPVPVFFLDPEAAPETAAPPNPVPADPPATPPAVIIPNSPPPAPVPPPVVPSAPAPAPPTATTAPSPSRQPIADPDQLEKALGTARTLEGNLRLAPRRLGFAPKFPYDLVNEDGDRLAFVDTGELILPQPLDSYVGRRVILYGTPELIAEGPGEVAAPDNIVIRAQSLRLK